MNMVSGFKRQRQINMFSSEKVLPESCPHGLDSGHEGAEDSLAVASSHQDSQVLASSSTHVNSICNMS